MKVLVIGDAILDKYVYGRINRQSPEDPTISVFDVEKREYRLGGSMNVATNLRSISRPGWRKRDTSDIQFEVHLSSVFSRFTGKMLYEKGILCDDSNMIDEIRAGNLEPCRKELVKTRVIDLDTGKQIIRIDNQLKYDTRDIELYKSVLGNIDNSFDAVVVSDYAKGLVNGHTLKKLKNFKGPVFVDSKNPNLAFWDDVPNCIIKLNEQEYKRRTSEPKNTYIVTHGAEGATLNFYWGENTLSGLPFSITPVRSENKIISPDVVGAGDVFLSGFVIKYLRTQDIIESIKFANMVAGKSVKQQGTTEVSL